MTDEKQRFFSWRPIKNNSVNPHVSFDKKRHSITFQIKDIGFSTEIEPRSPVGEAEYTPLHHWGDDNTQ